MITKMLRVTWVMTKLNFLFHCIYLSLTIFSRKYLFYESFTLKRVISTQKGLPELFFLLEICSLKKFYRKKSAQQKLALY